MTRRTSNHAGSAAGRFRDRIFDDPRHDPYQPKGKYAEPTRCSACGAAYHKGHWQWGAPPAGAHEDVCPACRRIHDKMPAGSLIVDGPFVGAHRQELLNLVHNEAERERSEHPLNRVMRVDEAADRIEISTTDIHSPQRIGEALKHAYDGELSVQYGHDDYTVRVHWQR